MQNYVQMYVVNFAGEFKNYSEQNRPIQINVPFQVKKIVLTESGNDVGNLVDDGAYIRTNIPGIPVLCLVRNGMRSHNTEWIFQTPITLNGTFTLSYVCLNPANETGFIPNSNIGFLLSFYSE